MSNCFVEEACDFVTFGSMGNQAFEKNLHAELFIVVVRTRGKNSKQGAADN